MGIFAKDIKTFDDLFIHTLRDIYYAEHQIAEAIPDMIDKASSPELKNGFKKHLMETEGHIDRLNEVFRLHNVKANGAKCLAIDGILKEANEVSGDVEDVRVLDAALVAAAQAVEHYEITRYGTLVAWAKELGEPECASLLEANLQEEIKTDRILSDLAESRINSAAT